MNIINIKNILKIYGIWILVNIVFFTSWIGIFEPHNVFSLEMLKYLIVSLLHGILTPIIFCLIFSPTIIFLYFLFKRITDEKTKLFLIAFAIPYTNMIYLFFECLILKNEYGIISMLIGSHTLFGLLPLALITTLFIPKSIFPNKYKALITNLLMGFIGVILIIFSFISINCWRNFLEKRELNKYNIIIEKLESKKCLNGTYPAEIEDTVKYFKKFSYEPKENNQGYILTVSNSFMNDYLYCSNPDYYGCKEGNYNYSHYKKFGKWIKRVDDD